MNKVSSGSDFFDLYYELKEQHPDQPEYLYHRAIQQRLGYKCPHPFHLLRIVGPGGQSIQEILDDIPPELHKYELKILFETCKQSMWCSVCQCYPYEKKNDKRN